MTNNKQPGSTLGPIVSVMKRGQPVHVALVDSNRVPVHGFDVDYPANIHFRYMRNGAFSVFVATNRPVEVRIIKDGELLAEQRVNPLPQPVSNRGEQSAVRRQVSENLTAPQPFFLDSTNDHQPLMFSPDPLGRSQEERLQLQLHPDKHLPFPAQLARVHRNEPTPVKAFKEDLDPVKAGLIPPAAAQAKPSRAPANDGASNPGAPTTSLSDELTLEEDAASTAAQPAQVAAPASELLEKEPETEGAHPVELLDVPLPRMAPSYGMIAIGVRLVQTKVEGEPVAPPDGFDYVLFQLNTWEDHAKIRARLHSRIKLPAKVPYREYDDGQTPINPLHTLHGQGCGCSHGHDPRRFR
jgi:hypothetical protein